MAPLSLSAQDSNNCTNQVVIHLTTTVTIQDYSLLYPKIPIESFDPTYAALPDGSLVLPPTQMQINQTNPFLLITGALFMLFLRNTVVSADYIRRVRVKHKGLFYTLFASQLLGLVSAASSSSIFVSSKVNCTVVVLLSIITTEISISLLVTGIMGVKAYRCLNNSKFVLAAIVLCQSATAAILLSQIPGFQATHGLSGMCVPTGRFKLMPYGTLVRFTESAFICICFMYALWKSWRIPSAQGRLIIRLSTTLSDNPDDKDVERQAPPASRSRGWWDYVPEEHEPQAQEVPTRNQNNSQALPSREFLSESKPPKGTKQRPDSRRSFFSHTRTLNSMIRSRMALFRQVIQTELGNAAFTTLGLVGAAVLSLVAAFDHDLSLSPIFLLAGDWAIMSMLTMHSFSQVVARNEQEEYLRQASASDPSFRAEEIPAARTVRRPSMRFVRRPSEPEFLIVTPEPPQLKSPSILRKDDASDADNPFEDFIPVVIEPPGGDKDINKPRRLPRGMSWMSLDDLEIPNIP